MKTLNTTQSQRRKQLHVCPLQLDIVERVINRYSNPDDLVFDPFAGLATVPMMAVRMGRKGYGCELNSGYFADGVGYLRAEEVEIEQPSSHSNRNLIRRALLMKSYNEVANDVFRRRDEYERKQRHREVVYRRVSTAMSAIAIVVMLLFTVGTGYVLAANLGIIDDFLGIFRNRTDAPLSTNQQQFLEDAVAEIGERKLEF